MNFYNDNDPYAARWLENLIAAGQIPGGTVDTRSIREIAGVDFSSYTQAHFFAGIGGWPLALALAGWPATRPVWTGSCPCQPFSAIGRQRGTADERNLWPVWFEQIRVQRPDTIFGEQVGNAIGFGWLDGISADLEAEGYTVGAVVLGAHSIGAPHIRQRLYFAASIDPGGWERVVFSSDCDEDGNCPRCGIDYADCPCLGPTQDGVEYQERPDGLYARRLGESFDQGLERHTRDGNDRRESGRLGPDPAGSIAAPGGNGFWDRYELAYCTDGKARRIEPGTLPLADGVSQRVGKLRAYGNAIVPQVAAEFVKAFLESTNPQPGGNFEEK
jgi:DNA (cytosine-5)-methyltransferase 1